MQATRQIHTPKLGSKSMPASPKTLVEDLGRAVVLGQSQGPRAASSDTRNLPAESFKPGSEKVVRVGAGTPPRVQSEELSPRNLANEMDLDIGSPAIQKDDKDTATVTPPTASPWWKGGGEEEWSEDEDVKGMMKKMMKMMVTKKDLATLETKVVEEVKAEVRKEVKDAKQELRAEVKEEVAKQVQAAVCAGSFGGSSNKATEELWKLLDKNDAARKQVAFKGFSDSVTVEKRLAELEAFCREHFETKVPLEVVYNYPKGKKTLTGVVLADLGSESKVQDFVKKNKDTTFSLAGASVKVSFARTTLQTQRNTKLREAEALVKNSLAATDKKVELAWGNKRQVLVDTEVAFQQDKRGVGGTFKGAFSDLVLS